MMLHWPPRPFLRHQAAPGSWAASALPSPPPVSSGWASPNPANCSCQNLPPSGRLPTSAGAPEMPALLVAFSLRGLVSGHTPLRGRIIGASRAVLGAGRNEGPTGADWSEQAWGHFIEDRLVGGGRLLQQQRGATLTASGEGRHGAPTLMEGWLFRAARTFLCRPVSVPVHADGSRPVEAVGVSGRSPMLPLLQ